MSDSLQPHGLQHVRLPCLALSPRVCSNSCPLSQSCHPNISFSVSYFSSCPQSFPASGSFIEASASASVLPINIQGWFPLGLTGLSSCRTRGSQESSLAQFTKGNKIPPIPLSFLIRLTGPLKFTSGSSSKKGLSILRNKCYQPQSQLFYIPCTKFNLKTWGLDKLRE